MSYQIVYNSNDTKKTTLINRKKRKPLAIVIVAILLFGVLKFSSWDNPLWDYLIPGDANVTRSAFQNFTDSLKNGDPFSDAVFTFCDTVIQGATLE